MSAKIFFIFFLLILIIQVKTMAIDTLTFENCANLGFNCSSDEFPKDISLEEEKNFMLLKIMERSDYPFHNLVNLWNINSKFDEPPYGIVPKSYKTIKDAWLITPAVMPSVKEGDTFYVGSSGVIMSVFDYVLTIPDNYNPEATSVCTNSPPVNEFGDCKTIYTGNIDMTNLTVFQNGNSIGNQSLTAFASADTNNFESVLNIRNGIYATHYKWAQSQCCQVNYCCWYINKKTKKCGYDLQKCGCAVYTHVCSNPSDDLIIHNFQIRDDFYAEKERQFNPQDADMVVDYSATPMLATANINIKNLQSYAINTKYETLKKTFSHYSLNYTYPPQNILHVVVDKQENWYTKNVEIRNVEKQDSMETVSFWTDKESIRECSIRVETNFNFSEEECNLLPLEKSQLTLKTDKWIYPSNGTIQLTVSFNNYNNEERIIVIYYANQSFALATHSNVITTTLDPVVGQSLVAAYLDETPSQGAAQASINIAVYDTFDYTTIVWVLVLILGAYFGAKYFIKKQKQHA
jgi:hypothetical protein